MRTNTAAKLLKIVDQIDADGSANLMKLAVLKKWFERSDRLSAFAIWVATRAVSRKGKIKGAAVKLFREARTLMSDVDLSLPKLDRRVARTLHDRLRDFQNKFENQRWGPVRIILNWDLLLVEQALGIYLWYPDSPAHGYKLAANYCQHYDSRHGGGLNGPSGVKIKELARFVNKLEEMQEKRS